MIHETFQESFKNRERLYVLQPCITQGINSLCKGKFIEVKKSVISSAIYSVFVLTKIPFKKQRDKLKIYLDDTKLCGQRKKLNMNVIFAIMNTT